MTKNVLLDNVTHKEMKIITRYSKELGDNVNCVLTFPSEYRDVQREYPILFKKNSETGEYQSIAILGFEKGENLFLDHKGGWRASYVPAVIARGPFLIGFQEQDVDGELQNEPVIHVDIDNPRVNEKEGEPVFLPHGGNTRYLEKMAATLNSIHRGIEISKTMFSVFEELQLLEPVNIEVEVHDEKKYELNGYHTVSQQKLADLSGEALEKLNRAGFLEGAFLVIASLNNIKKLIEMKRQSILDEQKAAAN